MDVWSYQKAKVYLLVDKDSFKPHELKALTQVFSDPEINFKELVDIAPFVVNELNHMRENGYKKHLGKPFPFEIYDNIIQLAFNSVFKKIKPGLGLSISSAEPYASQNHRIGSQEDYTRLIEVYMSLQDPWTLFEVHKIEPKAVRPAYWSKSAVRISGDSPVATASTIADHVFVATSTELQFGSVPPTQIIRDQKEKIADYAARCLEVMHRVASAT